MGPVTADMLRQIKDPKSNASEEHGSFYCLYHLIFPLT